ncbi:hypothetical protein OsI_31101 [Oryza sativa Indica Group]|uniref:Uncharacterized protein n=1 Tax=Oryza sativa subsp. indica TaxID=39946 RepID=A2Z0H8_ORYSI|nr:hypothetical protein OsI_31101 [Oryza sativa Indica Group]
MGSSVSKQDDDTALLICKDRLRHIEQAIDARYALSAAQLAYEQSLRSLGIALRQFVEAHKDDDDIERSPSSSYAIVSSSPPHRSDVNHMKSEASTSVTVTINTSQASSVQKEQSVTAFLPPPLQLEFCSSWDFFDPTVVSENVASDASVNSQTFELRTLEDLSNPNEMGLASSIGNTSEIVEVQEVFGAPGWKQVHKNDNLPDLHHSNSNEIQMSGTHLPNDSSLEEELEQVQTQAIGGQNSNDVSDNIKSEANHINVNAPKNEEAKAIFITDSDSSKDFLSCVKDLERQFSRAAVSCHEVSRMLETKKIRLSISSQTKGKSSDVLFRPTFLIGCKAGTAASDGSEKRVTKAITWNRSLSSRSSASKNPLTPAQMDDEFSEICSDFVEEFCMISGSHASSLDRLYAWEMKLYNELKGTESLKKIYDKKCVQLRHQFERDASARQVDKTRVIVKDLYSRLKVETEVLYSISKIIEKLRDEELQPQLIELLKGLTRMWAMMHEIHRVQQTIVSSSDIVYVLRSPRGEPYKQPLVNLVNEMGFFYSSLTNWIAAYKCYVDGLHSWLQKCVLQPYDHTRGRRLTLSPRRHLAPPMFVLLDDWSSAIASLPGEETLGSIKNIMSDLKKMFKNHQAEGNKPETGSKLATLQAGLATMFDRLSKFSTAMSSLSESVKNSTEAAGEAYAVGRSG